VVCISVTVIQKKINLHQFCSEEESENYKNHNIQYRGMALLIVAAAVIIISEEKLRIFCSAEVQSSMEPVSSKIDPRC